MSLAFCAAAPAAQAQCPLPAADRTVNICSPADGATVTSPVRITAAARSAAGVHTTKVYLDGTGVFTVNSASVDTSLSVGAGTHRITVKSWDNANVSFSKTVNITVSGSGLPCALSSTNPSVTICQPANGATVTSPVRIIAGTTSSNPVSAMKIYVDGVSSYSTSASSLDTSLTMAAGTRRVTVKAWDSTGASFSQTVNITVSSGSGGGTPPCALETTDPSVTICQPANGASVTSPMRIVAGTTSSSPVTAMKIYVDGLGVYTVNAKQLDTSLTLDTGERRITVKAWNQAGTVFSKTINVTVGTAGAGDITKVKHIIFFMQENRSFDNYFGRMGQYRRDRGFFDPIDELPLDRALPDKAGHLVTPFHFQTVCHENVFPSWNDSWKQYNNGANDGFLIRAPESTIDPHGTRAIGYYDWTDLPFYYELAFQYGTSDRFFASLLGPTIPNRMYLFGGTSFGHIHSDPPPEGGFKQPTIFDRLTAAGISWRYYYQDNSVFLAQWDTWNRDSGNVYPISYFYQDIQSDETLPQVIFIERATETKLDEHPTLNIQLGAARVREIMTAWMNSPTYRTSVFFFTYDEGGGLHDHVPPPAAVKPDDIAPLFREGDVPGDFDRLGFRVPLIVISPWNKPHFVSHRDRDFTSILKFIERRFNLPALSRRDAAADDMTEFFDFDNPQLLTPPPMPAQPTNKLCDYRYQNAPGH